MHMRTESNMKSHELLDALDEYEQVSIVMHDNPDPDAIAAGWGIEVLIREKLNKNVRVVGGGAIIRAENQHMVELLAPPIELVDDLCVNSKTATVLVDCGCDASNHLLTRLGVNPHAIIDHHTKGRARKHIRYTDIRPDVAAAATISAAYLREQRVDPGSKLATAMLYAIRTETCGQETHHSALDREILPWLAELGDPALLAEIENAPLPPDYFGDLLFAIQNTFLYDDAALCFLPRAAGVEIVGEVADMLIRCRLIGRVMCAAIVGEDLFVSGRTKPGRESACALLVKTLQGLGGAGGHDHRAGGKIPRVSRGKLSHSLHDELRNRWLMACGVQRKRGTRLVAKWEIVENLDI